MARYEATVASRRGAVETFDYMATFSNAAQWDPGTLAAEQLDPGPVRGERAATGLARALADTPGEAAP